MAYLRQVIICGVLLTLTSTEVFSQQLRRKIDTEPLSERVDQLLDLSQDFLNVSAAQRRSDVESVAAAMLGRMTADIAGDLATRVTMLSIYNKVSSRADRIAVRPIIRESVRSLVRDISRKTGEVNRFLSLTKVRATAGLGDRLKKELREVMSMLESVGLNAETPPPRRGRQS